MEENKNIPTTEGEAIAPEAPVTDIPGTDAPSPDLTAGVPQQEQAGATMTEPGDVVVSFDKIEELMAERRAAARDTVEKAEPAAPEVDAPAVEPVDPIPDAKAAEKATEEKPQEEVAAEQKKSRRGRPPKAEKAEQAALGNLIRQKRQARGLSQEQLAQQLGVSNKTISKWENGKCMPDYSIIEPLCDALHVTLPELMDGEDAAEDSMRVYDDEQILDLLRLARDEFDASVLIITHNMGVIADIADQVVVMYRGHVVEQGDVEQIFYHPKDDYTKRLLGAVPRIGQKLVVRDREGKPIERKADWREQPIAVEAKNLTITYPGHLMQPDFKAVDGANFTIHRSEVLGLVGESGSGKSTTGRAIAGLQKVSGGSLNVLGIEMNGVKERDFKPKRADIGFVFQDPGSSFNPLMTIAENVAEPLLVHHKYGSVADAKNYVGDLLEMVQLPRAYMNRFPHELSGGQRQRASLARGLALKPSLLIADEPTSALDVSVQAKVLELFKRLQAEIGFACLFITHDLAVVDMLADRIMVMHKGEIVEHGDADQVMNNPQNPYTQKLLASLPVPDPREQREHRAQLHELLAKGI